MNLLLVGAVALAVGMGVMFLILSLSRRPLSSAAPETAVIQNQISQLQTQSQNQTAQFQNQMVQLQTAVTDNMNKVMAIVNSQLSKNAELFQQGQATMGTRLDNAARVVGDVQKKLGELGKTNEQIVSISKDISSLQQLLKAPKFRGGFGEVMLENLLREILPPGSFSLQYEFCSREKVDAAIHVSDKIVPIDSKFPLENFQKYVAAEDPAEKRTAYLQFIRDVKKHIDAIARKYILPEEGTFEFAMVYIPAENIYYHVIAGASDIEESGSLHNYAIANRVMPVSPASFYAYLQVILMGLRGLHVEERAQEIVQYLGQLKGDLSRFEDTFATLGRHVKNASASHDQAGKQLEKFGGKLQAIEQRDEPKMIEAEKELV